MAAKLLAPAATSLEEIEVEPGKVDPVSPARNKLGSGEASRHLIAQVTHGKSTITISG